MPTITHPGSLMNAMQFRGGSFSPLSIVGTSFWLSSQQSSDFTIADPNDGVSYRVIDDWQDRSTNNRDFLGSVSTKPAYEGCFASAFNSRYLSLSSNQPSLGTSDFSFSVRVLVSSISVERVVLSTRSTSGADVGTLLYLSSMSGSTSAHLRSVFNGTVVTTNLSGLKLGQYYTIHCTINRTGSQTLYVEGVGNSSNSISTHSAVSLTHSEPWYIGRDVRSSWNYRGFIREIAFYAGKLLNAGERASLHSYFVSAYPALSPSSSLFNLYHHYDFSNSSTVTLSGSNISAISDSGTEGVNLLQNTVSRRPQIQLASKNGLNTALFGANSSTRLGSSTDGISAPNLPSDGAILVVHKAKINNDGALREIFGAGNSFSTSPAFSIDSYDSSATSFNSYHESTDLVRLPSTIVQVGVNDKWIIAAKTATLVKESGNDRMRCHAFSLVDTPSQVGNGSNQIYFDGGSSNGNGIIDPITDPARYYQGIGARTRVSYNSEIAECIMLSGNVYGDHLYRLLEYLRTKWGFAA